MIELNFFFFEKNKIEFVFCTKNFKNFLFFIKLLNCLNLFGLRPINSAGNIPTSDKTEYLPPIKLL